MGLAKLLIEYRKFRSAPVEKWDDLEYWANRKIKSEEKLKRKIEKLSCTEKSYDSTGEK